MVMPQPGDFRSPEWYLHPKRVSMGLDTAVRETLSSALRFNTFDSLFTLILKSGFGAADVSRRDA
jgi:hypothetical protein